MKRRHDAYFHPQLCALSAPSRVPRGNTIGGTAIPFFISICIYTMKKNVLLSDLTFLVGEWKAELSDISFLPDRSATQISKKVTGKHIMNNTNSYKRREFLSSLTRILGTSTVMTLPGISFAKGLFQTSTVQEVINIIMREIPGAPFPATVDQLRSGSMDQEVTGIVTTMFPTIEVIEKTAKAGANFIIAHETPFYNNQDETDWLQTDDAYRYKIQLLNKHKIAIWRFHDYWHSHKPDGIVMGNLIKLGWEKYYDAGNPRMLTLPKPMSLKSIAVLTKERLGIPSVRVVGNLDQNCGTIYLAFGYMDSKKQIAAIQDLKPDLILSGETREWETVERIRDGIRMGQKTSLLVLSHAVSEEAGMEYAAKWLGPKVPGVRITHIPSTNPFTFF